MAHTVRDAAGKPVGALLDAEECLWIEAALQQYLVAEQQRQRKPSLTFPPVVLAALAALTETAERRRSSPTASSTSLERTDAAVVDGLADIIGAEEVAQILGIGKRWAEQKCAEIGKKVGRSWVTTRSALKEAKSA